MSATGNEAVDNLLDDLNLSALSTFNPLHNFLAGIEEHLGVDLTPPPAPTPDLDLSHLTELVLHPVHLILHSFEDALGQVPEAQPLSNALGNVDTAVHELAHIFDGTFSPENALDALLGHNAPVDEGLFGGVRG